MHELSDDEKRYILKVAQFKILLEKKYIDKKEVELIIDGLDLNFKVPSTKFLELCNSELIGTTLLHLAFEKKKLDVFNILIDKGADYNAKDVTGCTVLHKAFQEAFDRSVCSKSNNKERLRNSISLINAFIHSVLSAHVKYKNALNSSDPNGLTNFHIACASNCIEAVELFLSEKVPVNEATNSICFAGNTPLHFAVTGTCLDVVKILLKHGANVNLKNAKNRTPMHICIERNMTFIAGGFHRNVELNEEIINLLFDQYDDTELSNLYIVSSMQNSFQAENLLSQPIDVNQCRSIKYLRDWPGFTALHFAACTNINTVKLLIKHGAYLHPRETNHGATFFEICVSRYKTEEIFEILCLVPIWKDIVLSDGKTKLVDLIFAFRDLNGITDFLQEAEENVNLSVPIDSPLWAGCTVLHIAVCLVERANSNSDNQDDEESQEIHQSNLSIIAKCLKQGADVTAKNLLGATPVHLAFRLGKSKVVDLLLQYHHRMINCVDNENLSHLHIACFVGDDALVEKLLWNNVDVNVAYNGKFFISFVSPGSTPLHIAVVKRDLEIVKLLLKFGADPHAMDYRSNTAIHYLSSDHSSNELSKILFSSINLSDCIGRGMGPCFLHTACTTKNVDAVKKLLDLGVDVNQQLTYIKMESNNSPTNLEYKTGNTPLHSVLLCSNSSQEQVDIVNLLMERGADILAKNIYNVSPLRTILVLFCQPLTELLISTLKRDHYLRRRVETDNGLTLLHLACHQLDFDLAKELLDNGAKVNAQIHKDSVYWAGFTPLHVLFNNSKHSGRYEIDNMVKLLLSYRASVILSSNKQHTPLYLAWTKCRLILERMNLLVKAHTDFEINPMTAAGVTHFYIACDVLDVGAVEKFLEHNVDVNLRINVFSNTKYAGFTPLLLVTQKTDLSQSESLAQLKIIDLLIKHGADVNVADVSGNTAAHFAATAACSARRQNIIQLLANNGADVNARNIQGETPLEWILNLANLGHQELRHFIACGCIFNTFNPVTGVGYIALACTVASVEEIQSLLFGTFLNFPRIVKNDYMNRNVIHNIVSASIDLDSEDAYELGLTFKVLKTFGCDIDDQDSLGRTPLHFATRFRYDSAIERLLKRGADVNIVDNNGKTPFAYIFEPCTRHQCTFVNTQDHSQFSHYDIFRLFVNHIKKLKFFNLEVNQSNENLLNEALQKFEGIVEDQERFLLETEYFRKVEIKPHSLTVADFMTDTAAVVDYPTMSREKQKDVDEFFQISQNYFVALDHELTGISQLQYRKAQKRLKIFELSLNSLNVLTNVQFPYLCSHIILQFLKNSELDSLIIAAYQGSTKMEVDSV